MIPEYVEILMTENAAWNVFVTEAKLSRWPQIKSFSFLWHFVLYPQLPPCCVDFPSISVRLFPQFSDPNANHVWKPLCSIPIMVLYQSSVSVKPVKLTT
jgi:hypothetical protein